MINNLEPATSTLYLSRLQPNLRDRRVQRDLANSQSLHRRLLDAFPGVTSREQVDLLYRLDALPGQDRANYILLVQSSVPPDWSVLETGYLLEMERPMEVKEVGAVFAAIGKSQWFRFRLRANPTRKQHFREGDIDDRGAHRRATGPNGTRIPLVQDDDLDAWLSRKATQHGFRVLRVQWQPDSITGDRQRGVKANTTRLTHAAIVFDGVLEVTDPQSFRRSLITGIGPAKAYGFGLLSLAPQGGHR